MKMLPSLRISVTPECNLSCIFCHREGYYEVVKRDRLLPDEIARIVRIGKELGLGKVKITGGEPLLRNDIADILRKISELKVGFLSLTTNGVLLKKFLEENGSCGMHRINVSLHTLNRDKYRMLMGKDRLKDVLSGIEKAIELGITVELNTLVLKGINEDEIFDIIEYANDVGANIQFIELVKTHSNREFFEKHHYPLDILEEILKEKADKFIDRKSKFDRATFIIGRSKISTCKIVTDPEHCSGLRCKGLRITADGKIRFFLMPYKEYLGDLLKPLRNGASDEELKEVFLSAIRKRDELDRDKEFLKKMEEWLK